MSTVKISKAIGTEIIGERRNIHYYCGYIGKLPFWLSSGMTTRELGQQVYTSWGGNVAGDGFIGCIHKVGKQYGSQAKREALELYKKIGRTSQQVFTEVQYA